MALSEKDRAALQRFHTDRWRHLLLNASPEALLTTRMPTEATWLPTANTEERRAVRLAYWTMWRTLPQLLEQRTEPISAEFQQAIATNLRTLIHTATGDLSATRSPIIQPQPFRSTFPVIGSLIAGLRSRWNRIAAGPYADQLRGQQNSFNSAATSQLQQLEQRLTNLENDTLTDDWHCATLYSQRETSEVSETSEVYNPTPTFAALNDLLESVAVRLQTSEQQRNR